MLRLRFVVLCLLVGWPATAGAQGRGAPAPETQIRQGTGFILGRTIDVGTGQPIAGAVVTLTGYGDLPGGVPGGGRATAPVTSAELTASAPRRVITNSDGYFFFRELNGGRFSILASAMGYLDGGYLKNKPNGTIHFIDLAENEKRGDVPIKMWKYGAISGTVLDEAGEPAVGASVRLLRGGGLVPKSAGSAPSLEALVERGLGSVPRVPVSQDGHFSMSGVTPGQYTLVARTGVDASLRSSGPGAGTLWAETDVAVNGRDVPDVVLNLQPGVRVAGTIVFESTALPPPADVSVVRLTMSSSKWGATALGTPIANVTPAGAFVFPSLTAGPCAIKVTLPAAPTGAVRWTLKSVIAGGRDITDGTMDLRVGEDVNGVVVTLTDKETEISGTLLDAAGRPTPEFSIVVFATNRAFWTAGSRRIQSVRPATNGTFRIAGLPAGEYSLVAVTDLEPEALSDPAYLEQLQPVAFTITLADGEKKKQDLRIK